MSLAALPLNPHVQSSDLETSHGVMRQPTGVCICLASMRIGTHEKVPTQAGPREGQLEEKWGAGLGPGP